MVLSGAVAEYYDLCVVIDCATDAAAMDGEIIEENSQGNCIKCWGACSRQLASETCLLDQKQKAETVLDHFLQQE
jgi:hypothetical protein